MMKNKTPWIVLACLVALGLTSGGTWIKVTELRLAPLDQAPPGACEREGTVIYVLADGGHLCVCTRDPYDLGDPDLDWLRVDGEGECPDEIFFTR